MFTLRGPEPRIILIIAWHCALCGVVQVGSISCLLQYCSERSLREVRQASSDVTYAYMDECPHCCLGKESGAGR